MSIDLLKTLEGEKKFRQDQVYRAWFDASIDSYEKISTLPKDLREKLKDKPWLSVRVHAMHESKRDNTKKVLIKLSDDRLVEAVLMGRKNLKKEGRLPAEIRVPQNRMDVRGEERRGRDRYTICISSQVGCGMKCAFCATGKAGFTRNLTVEEIVDQFRFWQKFLAERNEGEIDNMVIMGQGEPLLNYENIKTALNLILKYTNIGQKQITLSTCGIPVMMDKLAADKDFPAVRFALSLHSAIEQTRAAIMPSHQSGFLDYLVGWSKKYHQMHPSRAHFIGLEYIMLGGVNDGPKDLKALMTLSSKLGKVKINLIPYNNISTVALPSDFNESPKENIEHWHTSLMNAGFTSTVRYSQGQDIAAACGQLRNAEEMKQALLQV